MKELTAQSKVTIGPSRGVPYRTILQAVPVGQIFYGSVGSDFTDNREPTLYVKLDDNCIRRMDRIHSTGDAWSSAECPIHNYQPVDVEILYTPCK